MMICSAVVVFLLAWLLYEYKQVASFAEQRVENDIAWLEKYFEDSTVLALSEHKNKKYLETKLMHQSVTDEQRFQRHYRSVFLLAGKKSCLESVLSYLNLLPVLEKQFWKESDEMCIN